MNSKEIDKIIDSTHRNLVDFEALTNKTIEDNNKDQLTEEQSQQQQKILELGRLTEIYESNLNILTNYLPSIPTKDRTRYHNYYSELEERAQREVSKYESMTAVAEANAAAAGITNPKQEMEEFAQQCKEYYLNECKKKQEELRKIKIVIHSDGTMTSTNTETGETARFDNAGNLLSE